MWRPSLHGPRENREYSVLPRHVGVVCAHRTLITSASWRFHFVTSPKECNVNNARRSSVSIRICITSLPRNDPPSHLQESKRHPTQSGQRNHSFSLTILPSRKSTPRPAVNRPVSVSNPSSPSVVINPISCREAKLRSTDLVSGGSRVLFKGSTVSYTSRCACTHEQTRWALRQDYIVGTPTLLRVFTEEGCR